MTVLIGGGGISEAIRARTRCVTIKSKNFDIIKDDLIHLNSANKIKNIIITSGYLEKSSIGEFSESNIDKTIEANFKIPILVANFASKHFPTTKLLFFSSSVVFEGRAGYGVYSASKTALEIFLRTLKIETPETIVKIVRNSRTDTKLRWDNYEMNPDNNVNLLSTDEVAKATLEFLDNSGEIMEIYKRGGELRKDIWDERA